PQLRVYPRKGTRSRVERGPVLAGGVPLRAGSRRGGADAGRVDRGFGHRAHGLRRLLVADRGGTRAPGGLRVAAGEQRGRFSGGGRVRQIAYRGVSLVHGLGGRRVYRAAGIAACARSPRGRARRAADVVRNGPKRSVSK